MVTRAFEPVPTIRLSPATRETIFPSSKTEFSVIFGPQVAKTLGGVNVKVRPECPLTVSARTPGL